MQVSLVLVCWEIKFKLFNFLESEAQKRLTFSDFAYKGCKLCKIIVNNLT